MKVLFFDYQYPNPKQDSGSQDVVGYLKILLGLGHTVGFISFSESKPSDEVARLFHELNISHWAMGSMDEERQANLKSELETADLLWIQRVIVFNHLIGWVNAFNSQAPIIFGTVDLHFLREMRGAVTNKSLSRFVYSLALLRQELIAMGESQATIVVSSREKRILKLLPKVGRKVFHIPLPRDLEVGHRSFSDRTSIGFIGGYDHQPNIDAVTYFLDAIWPTIHNLAPDITFKLAGSKMPEDLTAKASSIEGVEVVGFVENTYDFFNDLKVSVAPLRFGAGVKGKVLTSILHGVPVVASRVAAEGMELRAGVEIEIHSRPQDFARAVVRLYSDETQWKRMREDGLRTTRLKYSQQTVSNAIDKMVCELGS